MGSGRSQLPIGGELHRLLHAATAALMLPLHVKAAMSIRLPVQWLGGALMELFKGKGSRALAKNYREITVADLNGKDFGSFLRAAIMTAVVNLSGRSQHGAGLNGAATDACHLQVTQCVPLSIRGHIGNTFQNL